MSAVNSKKDEEDKGGLKSELESIPDDKSSKMSIWAKASSVVNPFKKIVSKEDNIVEEIVEVKES
jgi:hypothetical protein|tara:strand:+ start:78 stop:272 length:195 start_codon:yes stop_codon:yes gene_type:complete